MRLGKLRIITVVCVCVLRVCVSRVLVCGIDVVRRYGT